MPWSTAGVRLEYVWGTSGVSLEYVWGTSGRLEYVWSTADRVRLEYVLNTKSVEIKPETILFTTHTFVNKTGKRLYLQRTICK